MTIKAIETRYKGYRFRSRLEARWAVFFDKMGWDWKYEHEGYEIGPGEVGNRIAWLPDFEVTIPVNSPGEQEYMDLYVEVKGDPRFFAGDWLGRLEYGDGPPGHPHSGDWFPSAPREDWKNAKPLMILGGLPKQEIGALFVPFITHRKGIIITWSAITPEGLCGEECREIWEQSVPDREYRTHYASRPTLADFQPLIIPRGGWAYPEVYDALAAARSARFEHGETP